MHQKTQNHFLFFSIHLSVRKFLENYRQINGKSKESLWGNLSTRTPPVYLRQSFALQLQFTIDILFRTAVLRKLFDIRFSYKHCNFSRVCLLVKMASKTVTRSIAFHTIPVSFSRRHQKLSGIMCTEHSLSKDKALMGTTGASRSKT